MPRIAPSQLRNVWIFRMRSASVERIRVGEVQAFNLPDAVRRWYESVKDEHGYHDPMFTANTVTLRNREGEEELYVATD